MTFRPDALETFLEIFDTSSPKIRAFPGCHHLELWQDPRYEGIVTTYSHWTDSEALDAYRHSMLFRETWSRTRRLFAAPPVARSHHILRTAQAIEAKVD
jgi:quinol monooxygenase YgiN